LQAASCKRQHIEPFAYLRDLFTRISSHPHHRLDELLPDSGSLRSGKSQALKKKRKGASEASSGGRLKARYIAAKLKGIENLPHRRLKARELGSELRVLVCCTSEVQQLLADQIIQRVLDAETLTNRVGSRALLLPDLVKVHVKLHGE